MATKLSGQSIMATKLRGQSYIEYSQAYDQIDGHEWVFKSLRR